MTSNIERMDKKDLNEQMITTENHQSELSDKIDPLESANESLVVQINENETQMTKWYSDALKLNTQGEMAETFGISYTASDSLSAGPMVKRALDEQTNWSREGIPCARLYNTPYPRE